MTSSDLLLDTSPLAADQWKAEVLEDLCQEFVPSTYNKGAAHYIYLFFYWGKVSYEEQNIKQDFHECNYLFSD